MRVVVAEDSGLLRDALTRLLGDYGIEVVAAAGSVAASAEAVRTTTGKPLGVIWVDAHGDMNTPETSGSGNVHGMPLAAQRIAEVMPLTHFVRIIRGILLRGATLSEVRAEIWPLLAFLAVAMALSIARFHKRLD